MERIKKKNENKDNKDNKEESKEEEIQKTDLNLEDDILFGNSFGGPVDMSTFKSGSFEKGSIGPKFEKNDVTFEHEEEFYDPTK